MLDAEVVFGRRQCLPGVQRPEFRPQRVFIARDSLTESLVLGPRAEHGLETKSIWIFYALFTNNYLVINLLRIYRRAEKAES